MKFDWPIFFLFITNTFMTVVFINQTDPLYASILAIGIICNFATITMRLS